MGRPDRRIDVDRHAAPIIRGRTDDRLWEAFDDELTDFETGKGSVKLPYTLSQLPADLLTRMIRYRIAEHVDGGVKWM
ncbi:hypothetical protein [Nesterenkonia sp.]|uniref:hypothetical protein n=1 Tax=Nesterenkonia sp. TaxID=704201 RepID=UPI00262A8647|nr:hypothetical protein [Nesterenkonia sp.]